MPAPRAKVIEDTITNWSHDDPKGRFRMPVGVAYGSDMNFAIERKLREAGIEIPFPQRDVHIRTAPPADAARGEHPRPPETPRAPR